MDADLTEQCSEDYERGVLLYARDNAFALGDERNLAMALARLWDM